MSMPEFPLPNPDMTQEQALIMILSSIALEELALSHIINAEGEKIQYALSSTASNGCPASISEVLAVNQSVACLLEMVMQNQLLLKSKMSRVLEFLPKPSPCPTPPCIHPSPCPLHQKLCSLGFQAIPGAYKTCRELKWYASNPCDNSGACAPNASQIQLPSSGNFCADLSIEIHTPYATETLVCLELNIDCGDKLPLRKLFCHKISKQNPIFCENISIQMPRACSACFASLIVRSADCLQIKQGFISFTSTQP